MRPCGATRAGTQAPPLPISIIFFHAIPHKQNSVHAQFTPNEINRPCVIYPNEMRRGGACVPVRTSAQRRFHTKNIRIVCGELNDGCALVGRHGRAHRRRPYPSPSYFSTQSHTNKITIYAQSTQTKSTVPRAICPNEIVGAAPACPPERPHSGVSIPTNTRIVRGE